MEQYMPSSPTYSGPRSLERHGIVESSQVQDTAASGQPHVQGMQDMSGAPRSATLPPCSIRALVTSASRGFLTSSKRGHRTFRKVAGSLCRRAKKELGAAGLLWSKTAWDGGLHAAMAGIQALAGTADAGLQEGFERVLKSIRQAHLEGLQQLASASRGARRAPASPAPASRLITNEARPPAGGVSRKLREAREELATYLFGDKVPYGLLCKDCSSPAILARRGGKQGGSFECFCKKHYERKNPGNSGGFELEKTRAEWARVREVRKVKRELAQALEEDAALRREYACDGCLRDCSCWDATPKSRNLIAKLLLIGGIESNPGWPASRSQRNENKDGPASNASRRRPLVTLPSREDVARSWQPAPALHVVQRDVEVFEEWRNYAKLYEQVDPSRATLEGGITSERSDRVAPEAIKTLEIAAEVPNVADASDEEELHHQDMIEEGILNAQVEVSRADAEDRLSISRGTPGTVLKTICGATAEESCASQRSATSAASESGFEPSGSEEEGEDIEGAEFESLGESPDDESPEDRAMIDNENQDKENPVIVQGRIRAALEFDSESDLSQLRGRRFKPRALGQATEAIQARSLPSQSDSSAESGSTASNGRWAGAQAGRQLVPAAMETDFESDEFPALRKRRVFDGAARSPQSRRRRRRVLSSSSESSGENGSVSARQSDVAGLDEEVQQLGPNELVPDASASSDEPLELEDDGCFEDSDFGEQFTTQCVIEPRPRRASVGQVMGPLDSNPHPSNNSQAAAVEPAPLTRERLLGASVHWQ